MNFFLNNLKYWISSSYYYCWWFISV